MFGSSTRTIIQKQHKHGSLSTKPSVCWPSQSSDPNPVEHEWGELKRRSESDGSGVVLDEGMGSDLWSGVYLMGLEWFWMKECVLISGQVFIWRVWSGSGWRNGLWSLVRCLSDGSGVVLDEGMGSDLWSGVYLTGLEWFWMKEWALISGQVFIWRVWSGSGWRNGLWSLVRCLSDGSGVVLDEGMGSDLWSGVYLTGLEWFWMKEWALISGQVFIWRVWSGSGWRNGLWSLVRCLSDGSGVVQNEGMGSDLWSGVYLTGLEWFWMKEWALISGQVFIWRDWSGSEWRNGLWSLVRCLSDGSGVVLDEGMGSDLWSGVYLTGLEWFWMKEWALISGQVFIWRVWMKEWALISGQVFIWRVWSGSGWRNGLWSLIRCLSDGSGVVLDEGIGSYLWSGVYLTGLEWFWMKEWALISGQVFIWRVWSGSGWRNGLWSLVRCLSDGSGVVLDEGMGSDLWSGVYLTGLEWFWMKEWALISGQVFIWRVWMKEWALISGQVFIWRVWSGSGWRNGLWSLIRCLSDGSGVVLDEGIGSYLWSGVYLTGLEWFWMKEWALISGQVFIWRVWSGSGWRNGLWSLVRCLSDGSGWRNGLWSLVRCLSDGSGVVLDEGMGSDLWSGVYLTGLEWFWMKECVLISGQVFIWRVWSGSGWRNWLLSLVRCLSDGSGVVLDEGMVSDLWSGVYLTGLEWFWMKEWSLISGQVFIWRVWSGSGWRNVFWSHQVL